MVSRNLSSISAVRNSRQALGSISEAFSRMHLQAIADERDLTSEMISETYGEPELAEVVRSQPSSIERAGDGAGENFGEGDEENISQDETSAVTYGKPIGKIIEAILEKVAAVQLSQQMQAFGVSEPSTLCYAVGMTTERASETPHSKNHRRSSS